MHPKKFLVASGECFAEPTIHVWSVANPETFKILRTHHSNSIIHLAFSRDASLIVSIGMDKFFSIQITNWKNEDVLFLLFIYL